MDAHTIDPAASDDLTLARRAAAGETSAFSTLMHRHNQRLYRTVRGILRNEADAEEAVQEAWWHAFKHLAEFQGQAAPLTWLTRIAINEALMRLRRNKTRDAGIQSFESDEQADYLIETQGDAMALLTAAQPDQLTARAEWRRLLEARIDTLPERYRLVFMLRAVEGLPFDEVARAIGVSQATARMRYLRARQLLRKALRRDIDMAAPDAFSFAGERCDRIVAGVHARLRTAQEKPH